jgi:hypothetical protein
MSFVNRLSKEESADKDITVVFVVRTDGQRKSKVTWRITEKSKKNERREQSQK